MGTLFDPTGVFKKLDESVPKKKGQSAKERARDLENALAWMRDKGLVEDDKDVGAPDFESPDYLPVSRLSPEAEAREMEDALAWLRSSGKAVDADPTGKFEKLESMLPARAGQSSEDRAKEMQNALNWMRSEGLLDGSVREASGNEIRTKKEEQEWKSSYDSA